LQEIYVLSLFQCSWLKSIKLTDTIVKSFCARLIGTLRSLKISLYEGYTEDERSTTLDLIRKHRMQILFIKYGHTAKFKSALNATIDHFFKQYYRNILQIKFLSSSTSWTLLKRGSIPLNNRSANRQNTCKKKTALDSKDLEINGGTLRWKLIKSKGPAINNLFINTDIRAATILVLPGVANKYLSDFIREDFTNWYDQQDSATLDMSVLKCPLDLSWYGGTFNNKLISREDYAFFLLPHWASFQKGYNTNVPSVPVPSLLTPLSHLLFPIMPFTSQAS